jgi:hypothetical protein
MSLANFAVCPMLVTYKTVAIVADDDEKHVVAYVQPEDLDDFFPHFQISDGQRVRLVAENLGTFRTIISHKYERGEWKSEERSGCAVRRVDVELVDLLTGPRLLDGLLYGREPVRE